MRCYPDQTLLRENATKALPSITMFVLEDCLGIFCKSFITTWIDRHLSFDPKHKKKRLGRPLGYFMFSLIGLKRTLFTNIFRGFKGPTRRGPANKQNTRRRGEGTQGLRRLREREASGCLGFGLGI